MGLRIDYITMIHMHWILYITLHTTNLEASCQMQFVACCHVRSEGHSWLHTIAHCQPSWLYAPNCLQWRTPSLLDLYSEVSSQDSPKFRLTTLPSTCLGMLSRTLLITLNGTLPACLTVRSQVISQDALKHTPKHALIYSPNCTRWHTPSLLDYTLPSKLSRCS